ncbi:hypothetical protein CPSG_08778 [Coccidioides posadasii str. Silveira]|uniref:Uncharacterized protein n=2 Tax=Coccidioides posadasii TaxID=199306 RepID=E9DG29_COCPS|nr:hypothetical protein CPSG_08778 [Coccidioides posadasii str. Silveira]KMM68294.1 hypothetical protein CPAG_04624 [Coccidioides posadasii RMSCC 3488]
MKLVALIFTVAAISAIVPALPMPTEGATRLAAETSRDETTNPIHQRWCLRVGVPC